MIIVGIAGSSSFAGRFVSMRLWVIGGCLASAASLSGLALAAFHAPAWPLPAAVFTLGLSNGVFAVAAIGSMMALAGVGREQREGVRMGVWGAAQAVAFGLGGFLGTVAVDVARRLLDSPGAAYAWVFGAEGLLFLAAGWLALNLKDGTGLATSEPAHAMLPEIGVDRR